MCKIVFGRFFSSQRSDARRRRIVDERRYRAVETVSVRFAEERSAASDHAQRGERLERSSAKYDSKV